MHGSTPPRAAPRPGKRAPTQSATRSIAAGSTSARSGSGPAAGPRAWKAAFSPRPGSQQRVRLLALELDQRDRPDRGVGEIEVGHRLDRGAQLHVDPGRGEQVAAPRPRRDDRRRAEPVTARRSRPRGGRRAPRCREPAHPDGARRPPRRRIRRSAAPGAVGVDHPRIGLMEQRAHRRGGATPKRSSAVGGGEEVGRDAGLPQGRQLALGELAAAQRSGSLQQRLAGLGLDLAPALQRPQAQLEVGLVGVGGGGVDPRGPLARARALPPATAALDEGDAAARGERPPAPPRRRRCRRRSRGRRPGCRAVDVRCQSLYDRTVHMYTEASSRSSRPSRTARPPRAGERRARRAAAAPADDAAADRRRGDRRGQPPLGRRGGGRPARLDHLLVLLPPGDAAPGARALRAAGDRDPARAPRRGARQAASPAAGWSTSSPPCCVPQLGEQRWRTVAQYALLQEAARRPELEPVCREWTRGLGAGARARSSRRSARRSRARGADVPGDARRPAAGPAGGARPGGRAHGDPPGAEAWFARVPTDERPEQRRST